MFPRLITFVATSSGSVLYCNIEFSMGFYAVVWARRKASEQLFDRWWALDRRSIYSGVCDLSVMSTRVAWHAAPGYMYNNPATVEKDRTPDKVSLVSWECRRKASP